MIQIVEVDRTAPQPWKNGGGQTRELLAWPSADHFACRISIADITQEGPFSSFPGIERWFAVVEGAGVVLHFADHRQALDTDSAPLQFDGAQAPGCSLQSGATRDLNLMLRRNAAAGGLLRVSGADEWFSAAPLRAVFTAEPALLQVDDTDAATLPAMSFAFSTHAARQRWRLAGGGRAWWLHISPRDAR